MSYGDLRNLKRKIDSSTKLSSSFDKANYYLTTDEQPSNMLQSTTTASSSHRSLWNNGMNSQQIIAIALLTINTILLFADQNLMSPNLTAMATEFGFTDAERDRKLGGDIALAFFVLGAPVSLLIGCLADVVGDRTRLFATTIFVGEGSCLATYWVDTYAQLYVCRAITGISVGGALPLVFSILGDMFPADQRHAVSSLVGIGTGVGIFLGQGTAGFLGPIYGWRLPFLVVSAPALLSGLAFWIFVQDPERGQMEEVNLKNSKYHGSFEEEEEVVGESMSLEKNISEDTELSSSQFLHQCKLQLRTFRTLMTTPTVVLCLFQGAPGCVPWGIINVFLADFLAVDGGMSVQWATMVLLVFGVGNFVGILFGGFLGSFLYRIDKRYPAVVSGLSAMLGSVPFWGLLNLSISSEGGISGSWLAYPMAGLCGFAAAITGPIVKATLQNSTLPSMRGQAFALFNTFDDFGRGLGPLFVAMMIESLGGRLPAFNIGAGFWMICGVLNLSTYFTVVRDEERVQLLLEDVQSKRDHKRGQSDRACLIQIGPLEAGPSNS